MPTIFFTIFTINISGAKIVRTSNKVEAKVKPGN